MLHDVLPASLVIPMSGPIDGSLSIPGSKSLTNRALLLAALAQGDSFLHGMLHSEDTQLMMEAWQKLGVRLITADDGSLSVHGCGGKIPAYGPPLYVGNAGTAARFLCACLCLGSGRYTLHGNARMAARPIADLIDALRALGCSVHDINGSGCPPLTIDGGGLRGGRVRVRSDKSSQYLSALMMAAPYATGDTYLEIEGGLVSHTYVKMTEKIMADFGVRVHWRHDHELHIPAGQAYQACSYRIESDASSASYFFAMAAITGGSVTVRGFRRDSTQGDLGLVAILAQMGCQTSWVGDAITVKGPLQRGVDVDMNTMSDVAPTLAAVAVFAPGITTIRNVSNMRLKECDRITAVCTELAKLGAEVEEREDGLRIQGGKPLRGASLATYEDHRMAMALSLLGLKVPEVEVQNPACCVKTFPDFYSHFFALINP